MTRRRSAMYPTTVTITGDEMLYFNAATSGWDELATGAAGRAILASVATSDVQAAVDLEVGVDVQAYSANLVTLAGITPGTAGQAILADATVNDVQSYLSLVPGTNVQAYSADLTTLAGLTLSDGDILIRSGGAWTASGRVVIDEAKFNTIMGPAAGESVTTGGPFTFYGRLAGADMTDQPGAVFFGDRCGDQATGRYLAAFGSAALRKATGNGNTAFGNNALSSITDSEQNTCGGMNSGANLGTGCDNNTVWGYNAAYYRGSGTDTLTTANDSTYFGAHTRASANAVTNETAIGYNALGNGSHTVTVGNTSVIATYLAGVLHLAERSADPAAPAEGTGVVWISDGTGLGDDGDWMIAGTAGGATKYTTLFDHSAGTAWPV